jgi:peptidoglycan hydrolase-like protein with peptidoglycan-binding domain
VEDLQKILKDKGFDPGDVDGAFGPNTLRAALKAVRSL